MSKPVFRFAPSPTGLLHAGHAFSALYNQKICRAYNGRMLLRIENTDLSRCRQEYEDAIVEDLHWIGFEWEGEARRQSDHFDHYSKVLKRLIRARLIYPSFMSRGEIKQAVLRLELNGIDWAKDPDGVAHYPGLERDENQQELENRCLQAEDFAWRLDHRAVLHNLKKKRADEIYWQELLWREPAHLLNSVTGLKVHEEPCNLAQWGDVVLARKYIPARYHLACVIDDGLQGVTHVVRGRDLFAATSIHRFLQQVLEIPAPIYCHHGLIEDPTGKKLAKSRGSQTIRELREAGISRMELYEMIGISP